jgi:hypothetical protein
MDSDDIVECSTIWQTICSVKFAYRSLENLAQIKYRGFIENLIEINNILVEDR